MIYYSIEVPTCGYMRLGNPTTSDPAFPTQPGQSGWAITSASWVSNDEGIYIYSHADMNINTNISGGGSYVTCEDQVIYVGGSYSRCAQSITEVVSGGEEERIGDKDDYDTTSKHHETVNGNRTESSENDYYSGKIMLEKSQGDKESQGNICYGIPKDQPEEGDKGKAIESVFTLTFFQNFTMTEKAEELLHPAVDPFNTGGEDLAVKISLKIGGKLEINLASTFSQIQGVKLTLNFTSADYLFNYESKIYLGAGQIDIIGGKTQKIVLGSEVVTNQILDRLTKQLEEVKAITVALGAKLKQNIQNAVELDGIKLRVQGKRSEDLG